MDRWYAVHTHARGEPQALTNLERQYFQAYLPRHLKRLRHARRTDWVAAPLFPRYLFVRMDTEMTAWRSINSTIGVRNLVCFGGRPVPVPNGIVENILDHEDDAGMVVLGPRIPFTRGEPVNVVDGVFRDHQGLFDCVIDEERVVILLNLLGRQLKVRIPSGAIVADA